MAGIKYVLYQDINKKKWDECIARSLNTLIYANALYLDAMSANWDALVLGDYEAVMPLTWKKKWGIKYLYQPAFMQQAGIYYTKILAQDITFLFYTELHEHFRFAEIALNHANAQVTFPGFHLNKRNNYILDVNDNYENITNSYSKNALKELRRLKKFDLKYVSSNDTDRAVEMYRQLYKEKMSYSKKDYEHFKMLCKDLMTKDMVLVRQVINQANEILAIALFLKDKHRLYNIISCIFPAGKKYSANYFLYDELVKEFSGQPLLLDFEGSDVEGVKYFYEKFTSVNQPYLFMKFNRLPWPLKFFKR